MDRAITLDTLSLSLIDGVFETPLWNGFLEQLRRKTGADFAILLIQPPNWALDEGVQLVAGDVAPDAHRTQYRKYFHPVNPVPREWAAEGQPLSMDEMIALDNGVHSDFYASMREDFGIVGVRQVRVQEASGVDAWLTIVRRSQDFSEADASLLAALAPALRGVVRSYIASDRDRLDALVCTDVIRRLQFGWLALDRTGMVLGTDDLGQHMLTHSRMLGVNSAGRLFARDSALEREIIRTVAEMAIDPAMAPRAIALNNDPFLEMLLVPSRPRALSLRGVPVAVAYIRGDNWQSMDRCRQLIDMFGLSKSQARLALALCRGVAIAQAAAELDMTVETARSYSKIIYAKTGARSLHDLVRVIMGGVLALAPGDASRAGEARATRDRRNGQVAQAML
ncbi:helix-turn-helix transcriptional regulator [Sphingobium sufflavum]|uniref:helix-turn-helix transcriptional regulator n=1 Tax=Sphingobium sufflavum TaxID=1129547 RepID=UPI001F420F81|nr:helix-turn-helix transcriptional regulator [Sphingobium sufflavum]MCE7796502.1 helix-turn-helix transcriptional regulator [Sphingobium sufflavum]